MTTNGKPQKATELEAELLRLSTLVRERRKQLARLEEVPEQGLPVSSRLEEPRGKEPRWAGGESPTPGPRQTSRARRVKDWDRDASRCSQSPPRDGPWAKQVTTPACCRNSPSAVPHLVSRQGRGSDVLHRWLGALPHFDRSAKGDLARPAGLRLAFCVLLSRTCCLECSAPIDDYGCPADASRSAQAQRAAPGLSDKSR